MYRNRNNAKLMEELEGREMAVATMNMPANYKNVYRNQIRAIKQELARRWRAAAMAKNEPRRQARAAKVIQSAYRKYKTGGTATTLRAKLEKLRHARNTGNRGNMVNIYNSMGNAWARGGGMNGANVMNNAQKIMFRAGLI